MFKFDSQIKVRGGFPAEDYAQEDIKDEPMFFNCNLDFAFKNGGPITKDFIQFLPMDWIDCNPVLDSRVHMLMPNWYPCIPGFHHDDVPRSARTHGQPDYENMTYCSEHLMGLVNGDICPTEFAIGKFEMPEVDTSKDVIYRKWDEVLTGQDFQRVQAPSGVYVQFDFQSFHTGTKAVKSGWRWFIRLSRNTDRQKNITNEIRRNAQVYLEFPTMGW
jgi:hypothetical protein